MNDKVKLTKGVLNEFLKWTKSRYNDYLGYGTKKWNVDRVFNALKEGNYKGQTTFIVQCAGSVGENPHLSSGSRSWRTKESGDIYTVDCAGKTISAQYSKRIIAFL